MHNIGLNFKKAWKKPLTITTVAIMVVIAILGMSVWAEEPEEVFKDPDAYITAEENFSEETTVSSETIQETTTTTAVAEDSAENVEITDGASSTAALSTTPKTTSTTTAKRTTTAVTTKKKEATTKKETTTGQTTTKKATTVAMVEKTVYIVVDDSYNYIGHYNNIDDAVLNCNDENNIIEMNLQYKEGSNIKSAIEAELNKLK